MYAAMALALGFSAGVIGWYVVGDAIINSQRSLLGITDLKPYRWAGALLCGNMVVGLFYLVQKASSNGTKASNLGTGGGDPR